MRALIIFALMGINTFANSQPTIELTFQGKLELDDTLKKSIVKLIKGNTDLSSSYSTSMDQAFDFLDPQDPRRMGASDIANLEEYSVSTWKPISSFRIGQGDSTLCDSEDQIASYEHGSILIGFDTSYKREQTYGFWASAFYTYDYCESEDFSEMKKSRLRLTFNRWISSTEVDLLLQQSH